MNRVAYGMFGAIFFVPVFLWVSLEFGPFLSPQSTSVGERLAYAVRCDLFAAFALAFGIICVAEQRYRSPNATKGSCDADESSSIPVNIRYIQNTLEQTVLLFMGHLALALVLKPENLKILPILVILFIIGRLSFWVGYFRSPIARAFGFAVTFYPNLAVLAFSATKILMG